MCLYSVPHLYRDLPLMQAKRVLHFSSKQACVCGQIWTKSPLERSWTRVLVSDYFRSRHHSGDRYHHRALLYSQCEEQRKKTAATRSVKCLPSCFMLLVLKWLRAVADLRLPGHEYDKLFPVPHGQGGKGNENWRKARWALSALRLPEF